MLKTLRRKKKKSTDASDGDGNNDEPVIVIDDNDDDGADVDGGNEAGKGQLRDNKGNGMDEGEDARAAHLDARDDDNDDDADADDDGGKKRKEKKIVGAVEDKPMLPLFNIPQTASTTSDLFPPDYGATLYARLASLANTDALDTPPSVLPPAIAPTSSASSAERTRQIRTRRLKKELKAILTSSSVRDGAFTINLHKGSMSEWDVKLYNFDEDSDISKDLSKLEDNTGIDNVWIRITIPDGFPFSPPFVRVLAPYVQSGYVMSGGAVCMELLTPDGWSQAYRMEAVIQQLMSTLAKGGSRIRQSIPKPLTPQEAKRAYDYLVKAHKKFGWRTPPKHEG